MFCNKCGKEINDDSMFCSFCGAKQIITAVKDSGIILKENKEIDNNQVVISNDKQIILDKSNNEIISENDNKIHDEKNIKDIICPNCNSENVQKFSIVYLNGFGTIDGTTIGTGTGGLYGGVINGTSQTALSEVTAPPKKRWVIRRFILMFMLLSFVIGFAIVYNIPDYVALNNLFIIVVGIVIPIYYAFRGFWYNKNYYQLLYYFWDKKFLCLKCGKQFYRNDDNHDLEIEANQLDDKINNWRKHGKFLFYFTIFIIVLFFGFTMIDKKISGSWSANENYYYDQNGLWVKNKLINYHGNQYFITENGTKLQKSWKEIDGGLYYFNAKGIMVKNKWINFNDSKFHVDANGRMETNKWIKNRYVGADGKMLTNTTTPDGYKVDSEGYWIK